MRQLVGTARRLTQWRKSWVLQQGRAVAKAAGSLPRWALMSPAFLLGLALPLLGWVLWRASQALYGLVAPTTPTERTDFLGLVAQFLLGVVGILALYLTWRRIEVAQQGQITDRFTRAVEQLGNTGSMDVRLGGIYALERIAQDSERDHWPIMEVLTAHVRQHAPWGPAEQQVEDARAKANTGETAREGHRPAADIQAVLTVLGRRERTDRREGQRPLDLSQTQLGLAVLTEANLQGATLVLANLQHALLIKANLQGANLVVANLQGALLIGANLQGADMVRAYLQGADLTEANLQGARLGAAHLDGADLVGANLQGVLLGPITLQEAYLRDHDPQLGGFVVASLDGADLTRANLQGAVLMGANLQGAVLFRANLQWASLNGANLQRAVLWQANLLEADLSMANLQGADLHDADLQGADLQGARYDKATRFPDGFDPVAAGMRLVGSDGGQQAPQEQPAPQERPGAPSRPQEGAAP